MSTRRRRQVSPETPTPYTDLRDILRSSSTIHIPAAFPNFVVIGEYVERIKNASPAARMTYNHQCFVIEGLWSGKLLRSVLDCSLFEITGVSSQECDSLTQYRVNLATFNDFDYEHFDDWLTEHTAFTGRIQYSLNGLIIVDIYSDIDVEVFKSKCPGVLYFCGALKK